MEEFKSDDFLDIVENSTDFHLSEATDSSESEKYYVNAILPDDFLDDEIVHEDSSFYKNIDGTFDLKYYLKDEAGIQYFSGKYESVHWNEELNGINGIDGMPLCDTDDESISSLNQEKSSISEDD